MAVNPISTLALVFIILAITGVISSKVKISPILLFILFGMIMGPNLLNLIQEDQELLFLKQIGLIILLFLAGLEFNFENLSGKVLNAIIIATPPAIVGFGLSTVLFFVTSWFNLVEMLVLGLILTTTSISLSLSVLREKLGSNSEVYHTMVLAIILSNVVMILVAGLITRSIISTGSINFLDIFGNFIVVIVLILVITYFSRNFHFYWVDRMLDSESQQEEDKIKNQRMQFALGVLGFILLIAYLLNIDLAIASFFAGIYVSQTTRMQKRDMIKMNALGYGLLIPIFFFAMGLQIDVQLFAKTNILLQISIILILSFLGQVTLTAISSLMANFTKEESINLGIGLSACSLSGGFAVLSIGFQSGQIGDANYSIFAAVISLSVLMTIIGLEIFDLMDFGKDRKTQIFNSTY